MMDTANNVIDSRLANIESFDLRSGSDATLTIGLDDVLAATDGVNALTGYLGDDREAWRVLNWLEKCRRKAN